MGVVFARRPGPFALVFDLGSGTALARFDAGPDRHFYGHGVFAADGRHLFTTENVYDTGQGAIGIRDAADGFRQVGGLDSAGIGPHELKLMPDGQTIVVANGGIRTHPDHNRASLNLATMRPTLALLDAATARALAVRDLGATLH